MDYPQKITFGDMRSSGVREILIYCRDHRCSHHIETSADGWADDVRLSDIEPSFTCTKAPRCGPSSRRHRWAPVSAVPPIDGKLRAGAARRRRTEQRAAAKAM